MRHRPSTRQSDCHPSPRRHSGPWSLLLALLLLASPAAARYDREVVLRSGESPVGVPEDTIDRIETGNIGLADDGSLMFAAEVDGRENLYLRRDGLTHRLLRAGEEFPEVPGFELGGFSSVGSSQRSPFVLNPAGSLNLSLSFQDPTFVDPPVRGEYRIDVGDLLLRPHLLDPSFIGGVEGQLAGPGRSTNRVHVLPMSPAVDRASLGIVREVDGVTGTPSYVSVIQPTDGETRFGNVSVQWASVLAVNDAGRLIHAATFRDRDSRSQFSALFVEEADGTRYYISDNQLDLEPLIANQAQIAEDGTMAISGQAPGFEARGIFRISLPTGLTPHVLEGQTAVGTGGATFTRITSWGLAGDDVVYFIAETSDQRMGLWRSDGLNLDPVALAGDQIPDQPNGRRFGDDQFFYATAFGNVLVGAGGDVFFTSRVQGAGAPGFAAGLFAVSGTSARTVIQSGERIEGETVDWINVLGTGYAETTAGDPAGENGQSGVSSPANSRGEIAFSVTSTAGNQFLLIARPQLVVNSTGDRSDADPGDGHCSCDPIEEVPAGEDPECTLRAALEEANADADLDRIRFALPGGAPWRIAPATLLPEITAPVDVQGPMDESGPLAPRPQVVIESGAAFGPGLRLGPLAPTASGRTSIRGLALDLWESAIEVRQDGVTLARNWLGVDPWSESESAVDHGIHAQGVSGLIVVENRLDGMRTGLFLEDCEGATVRANRVGDGADDRLDLSTAVLRSTGILVDGGSGHDIGGTGFDDANVIAGVKIGVHLVDLARDHRVRGNRIGTDRDGNEVVPNRQTGIQITAAGPNQIGAVTEQAGAYGGNVIVGSPYGIRVRGQSARFNWVGGNLLGALGNGAVDREHGEVGIEVSQGAYRTQIGGRAGLSASSGNLVQDYLATQIEGAAGILLEDDLSTDVIANTVLDCTYGISLDGSQNPFVSANSVYDCFFGIRAEGEPSQHAVLGANHLESDHVVGMGIVMDRGNGRIVGNTFSVNSDAIAVGDFGRPRIHGNCFESVGDHGVRTQGRLFPLDAERNWWGDASGPSGEGPGTGAAVSADVDYDPWLAEKNGLTVASPESTMVLLDEEPGQASVQSLFFVISLLQAADQVGVPVPVEFSDLRGWLDSAQQSLDLRKATDLQLEVLPDSSGLAVIELQLTVPAGTALGTENAVQMLVDGEPAATTHLVAGQQILTALELTAPVSTVAQGEMVDLLAVGLDQQGNPMPFIPVWSASAGTISSDGRFVAPHEAGTVEITVTDLDSDLQASLTLEVTTSVGLGDDGESDTAPELPKTLELAQNHPNPFNPSTVIEFALPRDDRVRLDVYDLRGQHLRTLTDGELLAAGMHQRVWQGRDDRGRSVASGVYVYRLVTSTRQLSRQMSLLK